MRTTVNLADDVAIAVAQVRRERSIGMSEAINALIRAGLTAAESRGEPFQQTSHDLGPGMDVTNIGETLETLDRPDSP